MSAVLAEFVPGVSYDLTVKGSSANRRLVGGVKYELACAMLKVGPKDQTGLIPADNGAINLKLETETFDLFEGRAKVVNNRVDPDGVCTQYVSAAVSDVASWRWLKLRVDGGEFDGYCLLGVKHDTQESVLVRIDL